MFQKLICKHSLNDNCYYYQRHIWPMINVKQSEDIVSSSFFCHRESTCMCWKVWINILKTLALGSMHWGSLIVWLTWSPSISVEACASSPISLPSIENLLRPGAGEIMVAGREEEEQSIAKIQHLHSHHSPSECGPWGRCWVLTQKYMKTGRVRSLFGELSWALAVVPVQHHLLTLRGTVVWFS